MFSVYMSWCRIRYFQEKTDSSLVSLTHRHQTVRLFGSDNAQVEELILKSGNKTPISLFFGGKSSKQLEMIICFDFKLLSSMGTTLYIYIYPLPGSMLDIYIYINVNALDRRIKHNCN